MIQLLLNSATSWRPVFKEPMGDIAGANSGILCLISWTVVVVLFPMHVAWEVREQQHFLG